MDFSHSLQVVGVEAFADGQLLPAQDVVFGSGTASAYGTPAPTSTVPEPSTLGLVGAGLVAATGVAAGRRRSRPGRAG